MTQAHAPSPPMPLSRWPLILLAAIYVATAVVTAITKPAWLDEAIMSDIAFHYAKEGLWRLSVFESDGPAWVYGPVYFWLQSLVIDLFGFHAPAMRAIPALATYATIGLVGWLLWASLQSKELAASLIFLLLFEPSMMNAAFAGRMDMLASLFAFAGLIIAWRSWQTHASLIAFGAAAAMSALAYLTTPRAAMLLPATAIVMAFAYARDVRASSAPVRDALLFAGLPLAVFFAPLALWVQEVGGLHAYIDGYRSSPTVMDHIGVTFIRSQVDVVLLGFIAVGFVFSASMLARHLLFISAMATFVVFSLLAKEIGPYRAMVLPYLYVALGLAIDAFCRKAPWQAWRITASRVCIVMLAVFFSLLFFYRAFHVHAAALACADAGHERKAFFSRVPEGSHVAGDFAFYYDLRARAASFIEINSFYRRRQALDVAPDYLVLSAIPQANYGDAYPAYPALFGAGDVSYQRIAHFACNSNDHDAKSAGSAFTPDGAMLFKRKGMPPP